MCQNISMVTHKWWDFKDDITEIILAVSLTAGHSAPVN